MLCGRTALPAAGSGCYRTCLLLQQPMLIGSPSFTTSRAFLQRCMSGRGGGRGGGRGSYYKQKYGGGSRDRDGMLHQHACSQSWTNCTQGWKLLPLTVSLPHASSFEHIDCCFAHMPSGLTVYTTALQINRKIQAEIRAVGGALVGPPTMPSHKHNSSRSKGTATLMTMTCSSTSRSAMQLWPR